MRGWGGGGGGVRKGNILLCQNIPHVSLFSPPYQPKMTAMLLCCERAAKPVNIIHHFLQVRGLSVDEAIKQCTFHKKAYAQVIKEVSSFLQ